MDYLIAFTEVFQTDRDSGQLKVQVHGAFLLFPECLLINERVFAFI